MSIQDRDWYKEEAKRRFQASQEEKAANERNMRVRFEQYIRPSRPAKAPNQPTAPTSWVTYALMWLGIGTLCFSIFSWTSAPSVATNGSRVEIIISKSPDGHHYLGKRRTSH